MAVTTTTAIPGNAAAYSPVIYAGTTTRTPFASGVRISRGITSFIDDTSRLSVNTTPVAGGFEVGDTILISGATGEHAVYNGYHTVYSIATSYIVTTTVYITVSTPTATATVTKQNNGLYIRLDVKDGDTTVLLGQLYTMVATDGTFSVDVSKTIQSTFGSIFTQTTGEPTQGYLLSKSYDIEVWESFQDKAYATTAIQDVSESQAFIAHRTTLYDHATDTVLLSSNCFAKGTYLHHFLTDKTSGVKITTTPYTNGAAGLGVDHTVVNFVNGHIALVVTVASGCDYVKIATSWDNGSEYELLKTDLIVYNVKSCNATVLYYLNRLGGYEGYAFTSYSDSQIVERVDKYKPLTWKERTLVGKDYTNGVYQSVRDLITSPEVWDESGVQVEVLTDGLVYKSELVSPQVVVKYKETNIQ